MTWTAASPGFPAAFSLLVRGGGAAASLCQRDRAAPRLLAAREEGARVVRPVEGFGERGQLCPSGDGAALRKEGRKQVLLVLPSEDARGRSGAEMGAERAGQGKAPAPAAGASRLPRPPEAQAL